MRKTKSHRRAKQASTEKVFCDCEYYTCNGGKWVSPATYARHLKRKEDELLQEQRRAICAPYVDAPPEVQEIIQYLTLESMDENKLAALFEPHSSLIYFQYQHLRPQIGTRPWFSKRVEALLSLINANSMMLQRWLARTGKQIRLQFYSVCNIMALDIYLDELPSDTSSFRHLRLRDITIQFIPYNGDSITLEKLRLITKFDEYEKDEWFVGAAFCRLLHRFTRLRVFALTHPSPLEKIDHDCIRSDELALVDHWAHPRLKQIFLHHSFAIGYGIYCAPESLVEDLFFTPSGVFGQWLRSIYGKDDLDVTLSGIPFGHDFWYDPYDQAPYMVALDNL
ncbi:hypothetical protein BDZ89DRAFT_1065091 [Hymenopellis radicata]|nr:hypothetical protein BDZ89DRAFT_1065091 [Hymenopellis radicata]